MQTFLPYKSFEESAAVLDRRRLGKQRLEAFQIMNTITGESFGWKNHPAVRMWRGHVVALARYGIAVCVEWRKRGYKDSLYQKFVRFDRLMLDDDSYPEWLGDEEFHASHRSNLLRKDPEHYGKFGWSEPPTLPYVWPRSL